MILPMGVDITPNDDVLPGISQLHTIMGAVMTIGLIVSVLDLIISAIVWGFRCELLQPAPRWPRQGRRPGLVQSSDHLRHRSHAD